MSRIENSTLLITGSASGIGLLMAAEVAKIGADTIVLWDINKEMLQKAEAMLSKYGATIISQAVDVRSPEQISKAASELRSRNITPDILINNAGIIVGKSFADHSVSDIKNTVDVNSTGLMLVAHSFLREMISRSSGHIVTIASAAGLMPNPGMSVYAASKWAAVGWSESLRIEMIQQKTGVKVTTVLPGYIDTGMFEGVTAPLLVPILKPEKIVSDIIKAIEQNKKYVKQPFMVKVVPLLRGILPAATFDFVAGKLFRVYDSMKTFKGRTSK